MNTKEDNRSLHKISSAAFVLSSTVLLGGMAFNSDGFHTIPSWLAPFDALFLLSTTIQAWRGIVMVLDHRKRDPELGLTQISMGLLSVLMALYSNWESPFCLPGLEEHWRLVFSALILATASIDTTSVFANADKIHARMSELGMAERDQMPLLEKASNFISFNLTFTSATIANLVFMANFFTQDMDRDGWLQYIQVGYNLPFASGADMGLIYFTTILASTIISYQSLFATLVNKKLISAGKGANIIGILSFIEMIGFLQLPFAHSLYGQ